MADNNSIATYTLDIKLLFNEAYNIDQGPKGEEWPKKTFYEASTRFSEWVDRSHVLQPGAMSLDYHLRQMDRADTVKALETWLGELKQNLEYFLQYKDGKLPAGKFPDVPANKTLDHLVKQMKSSMQKMVLVDDMSVFALQHGLMVSS